VVQCLPSKCDTLGLTPSAKKKKDLRRKRKVAKHVGLYRHIEKIYKILYKEFQINQLENLGEIHKVIENNKYSCPKKNQ
jgi:hypothetical protein